MSSSRFVTTLDMDTSFVYWERSSYRSSDDEDQQERISNERDRNEFMYYILNYVRDGTRCFLMTNEKKRGRIDAKEKTLSVQPTYVNLNNRRKYEQKERMESETKNYNNKSLAR